MGSISRAALLARAAALSAEAGIRLEAVLPRTEHPDPVVAAAFVRLLWRLPCDGTFARLMALSRPDGPPEVIEAAAHALGRYIWSGIQVDAVLDEAYGWAENVTAAQVKAARERLVALAGMDGVPRAVRCEALRSLSYDPDAWTVQQIEALARSDRVDDVAFAVECMGRAGLSRWHSFIESLILGSADVRLLKAAVDAAGEACLEFLEPRIIALTRDSRPGIGMAAVWALRNVSATPAGRARLFDVMNTGAPDMAAVARRALVVLDGLEEGAVPEA